MPSGILIALGRNDFASSLNASGMSAAAAGAAVAATSAAAQRARSMVTSPRRSYARRHRSGGGYSPMLRWFIRRRLAAFERTFAYDLGYARQILDADTGAMLALARTQGLGRYRRDVPLDVYYAAKLTSVLAEDCGPCTQLVVAMGLRDGASRAALAAV